MISLSLSLSLHIYIYIYIYILESRAALKRGLSSSACSGILSLCCPSIGPPQDRA